jgi:hypothetical protein
MTGQQEIRFRISDKLSGISSYEGLIDGEWVLFEYDAKNDLILYKFDRKRLKSGIKHQLVLHVTDAVGNQSAYSASFIW